MKMKRKPGSPTLRYSTTPILRAGIALAIALPVLAAGPMSTKNLVVNGSFDDPKDPLKGWQHKYDQPGESFYKDNDRLTSVVDREGGREKILRLNVETQFLADNPGVKVD